MTTIRRELLLRLENPWTHSNIIAFARVSDSL
jgi:hypothetical protein